MEFTIEEDVKVPPIRKEFFSQWMKMPLHTIKVNTRIMVQCDDVKDARCKRQSLMCYIRDRSKRDEIWAKKCFVSRTFNDSTFAIYRTF